jgi:Repeat of unknown function (DUF5648)
MLTSIHHSIRGTAIGISFAALLAGCGSGAGDFAALTQSNIAAENAGETLVPIYRFARISNGAYFYTGSAAEANSIRATNNDFRYKGVAFNGYSSSGQTVFRFANVLNAGYFFTASVAERDNVLNDPLYKTIFRLDSTTFQVSLDSDTTALPVYRIANLANVAYLYTLSLPEVNNAVNVIRSWRDEGLNFKVPAATASLATFARRYTGTYSGTETGTFDVKISNTGVVTRNTKSTTYNETVPTTGTISTSGDLRIYAFDSAGSSSFTGRVGLDFCTSGSWAYVGTTGGSTFTEQRIP